VREAEPAPPRGSIRFLLAGLGLRALGRPGEAETAFRRAIEVDPGNERAREELLESDREATPSRP
jgi:hypothetical protein